MMDRLLLYDRNISFRQANLKRLYDLDPIGKVTKELCLIDEWIFTKLVSMYNWYKSKS